jgi:hypothetical protein
MSGCGKTLYYYKEPNRYLRDYTDKLEKAANTDRRLRDLVSDYINTKNGIATAAKDLFSPIVAATDDQTKKQQDSAKSIADLNINLDRKQTQLANSLHVDNQIQANQRNQRVIEAIRENLADIGRIAEIQQQYIDTIFDMEKRLTEESHKVLKEVKDSAKKIEEEVAFKSDLSNERFMALKDDLLKQGDKLDELDKTVVKESTTTRTRLTEHRTALEEMHKTELEKLKDLESKMSGTSTSTTSSTTSEVATKPKQGPQRPAKEHDSGDEEENLEEEDKREYAALRAALKTKVKNLGYELLLFECKRLNIKMEGKKDMDHLKDYYAVETGKDWDDIDYKDELPILKAFYKKKFDKEWDIADAPSTSGNGVGASRIRGVPNKERLNLLLSSHKAGNSAGIEEFHKLLNKLLKQKNITKIEYDEFLKQWPKP